MATIATASPASPNDPQPGQTYERDGKRRRVLDVHGDRVWWFQLPGGMIRQSVIWNWLPWARGAVLVGGKRC